MLIDPSHYLLESHHTDNPFTYLLQHLPAPIYTCDLQGRINLYNRAAVELWERKPGEQDLWWGPGEIYKADGTPLSRNESPVAITVQHQQPVRGIETISKRADGTLQWVLHQPSLLTNADGKVLGVLNLLIDITESKHIHIDLVKTEANIRNFAKQQINLLEDERSRIAKQIHDEFGQQLAGIKMSLSSLTKYHNSGKDSREILDSAISEVDNTMQSLRRFATTLRPGILDTLGLITSIEWLVEEFETKAGIKPNLHINVKEYFFERALSTCFFRICQEALTNIAKHAQASEVSIQVMQSGEELKLIIAENGIGIASEQLENPLNMGIVGMRERAGMAGARLSISTETGSGTIITLTAKINGE
jgi:signal transduction histidine kinase